MRGGPNKIIKTYGDVGRTGAGRFGGECVGTTNKSDQEIQRFISDWVRDNPTYSVYTTNCQKFAIQFIR